MTLISDPQAAFKALKEFLRIVLIGAVSAGIAAGSQAVGLLHDPILVVGLGTFLTVLGKSFDKYIHENDNINANGITGF